MKKRLILLFIVLLSVVAIPVFAKGEEGFFAGDNLNLIEKIPTTSFVAGNHVEMSSEVDGINFVAGNNIALSSSQDYLFVAGNNIQLENISAKDVFVAGSSIQVNTSTIRDLYAAAQTVRIDSNISRNAYIGGDTVVINSTIEGNVNVAADDIRIGKEAVIHGVLKYPEKAKISISESAVVSETKTYKTKEISVQKTFKTMVTEFLVGFLSLLFIAFILLFTNTKFFKRMDVEEKSVGYFFKTALVGIGFLVLAPIVAILVMITVIGIPFSIISLFLYGILVYISMIPTAYYLGKWILDGKLENKYLLLGVSLLVLSIAKEIPWIGGLVSLFSLVFGLGMFVNQMKKTYVENKEK